MILYKIIYESNKYFYLQISTNYLYNLYDITTPIGKLYSLKNNIHNIEWF